MKNFTVIVLSGLLLLILGISTSDAQMCGCMGKMSGGMHEGAMPMMGGMEMKHHAMGMMPGQGCGMMGGGMMGGGMNEGTMYADHPLWKNLTVLGLDEKQKEALREVKHRVMKETIKKGAAMQIAQIELKDLLDKDTVDMKAVEAKLKQIEALRTDIHLSHIKAMEEIRSHLTPDQRKKLEEMAEKGPMMGGMDMMQRCRCGGDTEETETQPSEEEEAPAKELHHHH